MPARKYLSFRETCATFTAVLTKFSPGQYPGPGMSLFTPEVAGLYHKLLQVGSLSFPSPFEGW